MPAGQDEMSQVHQSEETHTQQQNAELNEPKSQFRREWCWAWRSDEVSVKSSKTSFTIQSTIKLYVPENAANETLHPPSANLWRWAD